MYFTKHDWQELYSLPEHKLVDGDITYTAMQYENSEVVCIVNNKSISFIPLYQEKEGVKSEEELLEETCKLNEFHDMLTLATRKNDEVTFAIFGLSDIPKQRADEIKVVVWNPDNINYKVYSPTEFYWFDGDNLNTCIEKCGYKFPIGLSLLTCWGIEQHTNTPVGEEYDYYFSHTYEVTKVSDKDLFQTLFLQMEVLQAIPKMIDDIIQLKDTDNILSCLIELSERIERVKQKMSEQGITFDGLIACKYMERVDICETCRFKEVCSRIHIVITPDEQTGCCQNRR